MSIIADLASASGGQDHTISRPSCHRSSRADAPRQHTGHRIPRTTLVTTREAPLFDERGTGGNVQVICPTVQAEMLRQSGTTGSLGIGDMRGGAQQLDCIASDLGQRGNVARVSVSDTRGLTQPRILVSDYLLAILNSGSAMSL